MSKRRRVHSLLPVGLLVLTSAIINAAPNNSTNQCVPYNCIARCLPGCAEGESCVLHTMSLCGQCPKSSCIKIQSIPGGQSGTSSNVGSNADSNNTGPLVGGLVGGLLGAGLILGIAGFLWMRRSKKNTFPFTFRGKSRPQQESTRQVMSGVIPVAYIPPSRDTVDYSISSNTEIPGHIEAGLSPNYRSSDNPFSDDHSTERYSIMTNTTNCESVASSIHQIHAPATQAFQVMRAKPQIMRVNTIRMAEEEGPNGLTRSASTRTVLTRRVDTTLTRSNTLPSRPEKDSPTTNQDNPFHDRHSTSNAIMDSRRTVTDSVVSGPSDGEITIFWDSSSHQTTQ